MLVYHSQRCLLQYTDAEKTSSTNLSPMRSQPHNQRARSALRSGKATRTHASLCSVDTHDWTRTTRQMGSVKLDFALNPGVAAGVVPTQSGGHAANGRGFASAGWEYLVET